MECADRAGFRQQVQGCGSCPRIEKTGSRTSLLAPSVGVMTSTIAPPPPPAGSPPPAHQVVRFLDSLSGALDRLADAPLWSMTPDEQRGALVKIHRQRARLEELELRMLGQADRD